MFETYVEKLLMNFLGFLLWIFNRKESNMAGTICFEVRIPCKKTENYFVISYVILQSDVRCWALFGFTCARNIFSCSPIYIATKTFSKKFLKSENTWGLHLNSFLDLEKPCYIVEIC